MTTGIFVTLTSSKNEFLSYPIKGWIEILEIGTSGQIISAVFRSYQDSDRVGSPGAPVVVKNPTFTYTPF